MDPEKVLAQIKKALGLEESATREQILAALDGIAKLQEARKGETAPEGGDAPEPPAEASKDDDESTKLDVEALRSLVTELTAEPDEDEPAAAAKPDEDATKADATGGEQPTELMEDALAGEAEAVLGILAETTGMDPAAVAAGLRENAEAVAQILMGQGDGTPAETPEGAMSRDVALRASKARVEALEASRKKDAEKIAALTKRIEEAEQDRDMRRIDRAIESGHILPGHRQLFVSLARADRKEFEAQLSAAKGAPAVPTEDLATGKGSKPEPGKVDEHDDPRLTHLAQSLRNAKVSEKRIAIELERARKKDFEGRA